MNSKKPSPKRLSKGKYRAREAGSAPTRAASLLTPLLAAMGGGPDMARLCLLWQNWHAVLGEGLAELALPLGHKQDILLVGAEDTMAAQELHLLGPEILDRANAFMEKKFFSSIKVSLVLNQTVLRSDTPLQEAKKNAPTPPLSSPLRPLGTFLQHMKADSPVARAYARFAAKKS